VAAHDETLDETRRGRLWSYLFLLLVGIIWSILAGATHAFSFGADLVTGAALGVFVVLIVANRAVTTGAAYEQSIDRPPIRSRSVERPARWAMPTWALLVALVVAFEIFNYFELPRSAHPTLSSFASFLAAHSVSRGLAFFGWLALGKRLARP